MYKRIDIKNKLTDAKKKNIKAVIPYLQDYMSELLLIYEIATPEKQTELRQRNELFNIIMTLAGR